jgi:PPOX class probable F420-dependent enzyme
MTPDERRAFMLEGTRTGKLATVRADGRPHAAPVWFTLDGDDVVFNTGRDSVKARNIRRDPRVTIVVDEQHPPYGFVLVEGTAVIHDDLDEIVRWATRIAGRYMGEDRAADFGRRDALKGEVLVRVAPDKAIGRADIAR